MNIDREQFDVLKEEFWGAANNPETKQLIIAYIEKWERIKQHPKNRDIQGYKEFLSKLLTMVFIEQTSMTIISRTLGVSRQRVQQIAQAFRNYREGKGTFGY